MVNCMEIPDFIELLCIPLPQYTRNNTENVLEKVFEKCLYFFLETCTHHEFATWASFCFGIADITIRCPSSQVLVLNDRY